MKKIALLICILFVSIASIHAIENVSKFYVWTHNGEKVAYEISENPKVTHDGTNIVVTTTNAIVQYPADDVWKFTLGYEDNSGIENIAKDIPTMKYDGNVISFYACKPFSIIMVLNINGVMLKSVTTDETGMAQIDISKQQKGIYIIVTECITYKLIKK